MEGARLGIKRDCKLTVCIRVDSAFATRTKTSASKQCSSIQLSKSGDTSIPGLVNEIHIISKYLVTYRDFYLSRNIRGNFYDSVLLLFTVYLKFLWVDRTDTNV